MTMDSGKEMGMNDPTDIMSWQTAIADEMRANGETWDDIVSCTLDGAGLNARFDSGYGGSRGEPFTLWTHKRVYFPVVYDGVEWVGSVSRKPNGVPTPHVGGE